MSVTEVVSQNTILLRFSPSNIYLVTSQKNGETQVLEEGKG